MSKVFVHFGAGAGDNDKGAFYRCGFTEFVKKNCSLDDKIFCVEANKHNIRYLRNAYKNFKNVKIYNLGLSTKNSNKIKFFYTDKDAPNFQVTSIKKKHVIKHYPNQIIKSFFVKAITPNKFFQKINQNKIDYLSIDIEGIDFEILMSINLKNILVNNISIEYLHLSKFQRRKLINYLTNQGYSYCGNGYDHNNYDYLFSRKKIYWNIFISKLFLWFISPKHYKYFNYFILK